MQWEKILKLLLILILLNKASGCGTNSRIINFGILMDEKHTILDVHNKMRQMVALGKIDRQPPALNMLKLKWSDELAREAQNWAMACSTHIHDPNRHLIKYYVGQNIATKWTTKPPTSFNDIKSEWITDAISKWFDEFKKYYFSVQNIITAHYTQLVWAETSYIGCGYSLILDGKKYIKKYVCNYGPSGNIYGKTPYQKGSPNCYEAGLMPSKDYPGLCEELISDVRSSSLKSYYYNRYPIKNAAINK